MTADPLDSLPTSHEALADMVAYQADSVVSRTMMKNAGGSLTLFAFDAGQGLSEHSTPHEAAVLIVDGTAEVTVGGRAVTAHTGQLLRLPASVPHALDAVEPFKMLLVMLREPA
jgi:quercetin dioxygenase-like cupin family protein